MTAKQWVEAFYEAIRKAGQGFFPVRFQVEELVEKAMADERERCAREIEQSQIWPSRANRKKVADMIRRSTER